MRRPSISGTVCFNSS